MMSRALGWLILAFAGFQVPGIWLGLKEALGSGWGGKTIQPWDLSVQIAYFAPFLHITFNGLHLAGILPRLGEAYRGLSDTAKLGLTFPYFILFAPIMFGIFAPAFFGLMLANGETGSAASFFEYTLIFEVIRVVTVIASFILANAQFETVSILYFPFRWGFVQGMLLQLAYILLSLGLLALILYWDYSVNPPDDTGGPLSPHTEPQ